MSIPEDGIYLHEIKRDMSLQTWECRIVIPGYDIEDPRREVGTGSFMRHDVRGILVRARPDDLRAVARELQVAALRIEESEAATEDARIEIYKQGNP